MSRKYEAVKSGTWIQPTHRDYRLKCCSCGLVHRVDFRVVRGRIQFRLFLDNRATAQFRRHMPVRDRGR